MKFTLDSSSVTEHSEAMRILFDCAIKNFGSIRIVNEFSKLPGEGGFEWGEARYAEIPMESVPVRLWMIFLDKAKSLDIFVNVIIDPEPQKITW